MTLAWDKFRFEARSLRPCSFSAALAHAWAWFKGAAARAAATARYENAPCKRTLVFNTMVRSPIRRSLTGQCYPNSRAAAAGYVTSMFGR